MQWGAGFKRGASRCCWLRGGTLCTGTNAGQGGRAGASSAGPCLAWPHSVRGRPGLACKGLTSMLHAGEPAAHARPKKDAADAYMRRTLGNQP